MWAVGNVFSESKQKARRVINIYNGLSVLVRLPVNLNYGNIECVLRSRNRCIDSFNCFVS